LTRLRVIETRTPQAVNEILIPGNGTVMMVINSM